MGGYTWGICIWRFEVQDSGFKKKVNLSSRNRQTCAAFGY